jgi:hypothetical protein
MTDRPLAFWLAALGVANAIIATAVHLLGFSLRATLLSFFGLPIAVALIAILIIVVWILNEEARGGNPFE